jgi:hypothetical protein
VVDQTAIMTDSQTADVDIYGHTTEYNALWQEARNKGWKIPINNAFPDHSWIGYWRGCQRHETDPTTGRPVPPHRSGGGHA